MKTLTRQDNGNAEFDRQYADGSSRLANEGLIGVRYRLPKAVAMLAEQYRDAPPMDGRTDMLKDRSDNPEDRS